MAIMVPIEVSILILCVNAGVFDMTFVLFLLLLLVVSAVGVVNLVGVGVAAIAVVVVTVVAFLEGFFALFWANVVAVVANTMAATKRSCFMEN
jgi:hypothetical protein